MKELPPDVTAYKRTESFTEDTVPKGLLADHRTAEGVWGLIQVEEGRLDYIIGDDDAVVLTQGRNGVVEPQVTHRVRPVGKVRFFVEFYR
jgi:tellurite resistance-related uncharacterized protein